MHSLVFIAIIVLANLASPTSADDCVYLAGNWVGTNTWGKYQTITLRFYRINRYKHDLQENFFTFQESSLGICTANAALTAEDKSGGQHTSFVMTRHVQPDCSCEEGSPPPGVDCTLEHSWDKLICCISVVTHITRSAYYQICIHNCCCKEYLNEQDSHLSRGSHQRPQPDRNQIRL